MKRICSVIALLMLFGSPTANSEYNEFASEMLSGADSMYEHAAKNARSRIPEPNSKNGMFLVVSKSDMTLTVYDLASTPLRTFDICCGSEYGDKQTVRDLRTPEGVFKVRRVEDSKAWRERFDNGTYSRPGAYGPYFIRLDYPPYHHIGIHGTYAPESIGHRDSHGCVRLRNADLCELLQYVYEDMPVIITPSAEDQKANGEFLLSGGVADRITIE
ncbi:MAG: L,D-transpeptidase [Bacteroidales bacterium]|nr:L,D-transpeptidase [Bacteroidales bacterium]